MVDPDNLFKELGNCLFSKKRHSKKDCPLNSKVTFSADPVEKKTTSPSSYSFAGKDFVWKIAIKQLLIC